MRIFSLRIDVKASTAIGFVLYFGYRDVSPSRRTMETAKEAA